MLLTQDGLIACGDNIQRYQLCDLFLHSIPGLSCIDPCDTIGWVSDQGTTNQVGVPFYTLHGTITQVCANAHL